MTDVGISVGIVPETEGARVIKRSLDDVAVSAKKVTQSTKDIEAAATKASNAEKTLAAETQKVSAATLAAAAAQNKAQNAMKSAEIQASKLAEVEKRLALEAQKTATANIAAAAAQQRADNAMRAAEIQAKRLADQQELLNQNVGKVTKTVEAFRLAYQYLMAGFAVRYIVQTADEYTLLNARLKTIAGSTQETSRMMQDLRRVSNETGSEIGTSLSILQRLSFVRNEIKASNNEMLAFTETVTKLGAASGAGQEAMKAGLTQLGQALSSQYTRAEEFNSIMENIPGVGKAIADQLGVTTGQLRLLVVEGKLLSSDVFAAILNQTEETRKAFEEMPKTAEQGFAQLKNSVSQIIDQLNNATGGTNALGAAMRGLGEGAKLIYDGLATAFDFLVAGIQEGVNLIDIALNRVKGTINDISKFIPGYDSTNFSQATTVEAGSIFAAASAARKARASALFTDPFAAQATPEQRKISQDYAKIAAGLGGDKEADKAAKKAAAEAKRQQQELQSAINGSRTEMEKLNDEMTHLEKLKGVAKTAQEVELLNRGIRNTQAEIDKLNLKTELDSPLAKGFAAVADEIQDGFKDAFKGAFDGGGSLFKKMADGIKATFKSLLLDLAYQAAVRPILVSVLGAGAGMLGLSSGASASILGTGNGTAGASGGMGVGNLSSLSGLLHGGLYSSTLAGVGTGLGNLLSGQAYNFMGPTKFGSIGSGAFGNLGYGAVGGLGASLLGLGNKNAAVNFATGTLGSLAGGAIGTSLGTILGLPGGPVGAALGGFAGTALGGLFGGGKPSDKAQGGVIDFATLAQSISGQTGKKYSAENASFRDGIINTISGVLGTVQQYGGSASGSANITIGSRDGLRYNGKNFGNDSASFQSAIFGDLKNSITGLDGTFKTILDKVGVTNSGNLANAFAFGQSYNDAIKATDVSKVLADSIKALDDNMSALLKTATDLGLPIDEYTKALQKQKDASIGLLKAQAAGFSSFEQLTNAFDSFFNGQALGSNSSLTPMGKLQTAQNSFGSLLSKAQGGDLSVTPDLLNAANSLLEQGRGVYASGVDFSNLEGFVRSSVQGVASQTGYTGQNVAYNIVTTNQQLVAGNAQLVQGVQDMKAEIYRLNNKITALVA